jgi:hypothetical protein
MMLHTIGVGTRDTPTDVGFGRWLSHRAQA